MANEINGVVVTFKAPIREERAKKIIAAIEMLSDVAKVEMSQEDFASQIARTSVRMELAEKLWEVLK